MDENKPWEHIRRNGVRRRVVSGAWKIRRRALGDGYILRFMHEFGLMVSTQAVGMASHTISALWERWFNYCEGSWRSVPRVRH